ncbi:hypothetical protein B9Z55_021172 [Caenorhabditis nigoni]|uniref:Uncharacterized protein n=1 Tax=Caenorhabditis nigoni TaxID=1611254 RepID=A0A2G5TQT9_9PELO|nr:hypothetical protein B9Z55_021172 [Caenorhabditis nigoni]
MDDTVIKEEVIEETCYFTFKNGEYIEVKREEIDQKPENLLEKEIKTEPDEFFDDFGLEPEENDSKIETVSTEFTKLKCEICLKTMPKNRLKLVKSEANKILLSEIFKIEGSLKIKSPYVCVSHIQTIIDDYDGTFEKYAGTPFEKRLRLFIRINKSNMQVNKNR